jgi:hypothetical protein
MIIPEPDRLRRRKPDSLLCDLGSSARLVIPIAPIPSIGNIEENPHA